MKRRGQLDAKFVLFEQDGRFFCYTWPMTMFGPSHNWIAKVLIDAIPGIKIVWGDSYSLDVETDPAGLVKEASYRTSHFGRMNVDDEIRHSFMSNEERLSLTEKYESVDTIVFGFIKKSLSKAASKDIVWEFKH